MEAEHVLFQSAEQNPRYHLADILLPIADIHRASVLVAGYSPDVRLLWEMQKRKLPVRSLGERLPNPTLISLTKGSFQRATAVPHEVMTLLEDFPDKRILILYNRIGDIRTLQCRDCGALPSCPTCGKPYMVDSQRNTLVCMTDATERPMIAQCEQCHGVNLDTKGFGIERIAKEVRAAFPDRQVITFSRVSDNAQSARSKGDTSDTGGVIVIATTSILFTQQPSFDAVIWLKPETDLAHTSFHAAERVRHDIKKLQADHTNLTLITATPEHPAFTTLGSVPDFFQNEIIWRKKFSYAPFGTLYKGIIVAPSEADARRLAARITAPLKQYSMLGPHGKASKGRFRLTFSYKAKTEAERTALDAAFRGSYNGFHLEINPYSLD